MLQIQIASSVVNSLRSEYYDTDSLTDLKLTRIDSTVNFSWGTGSSSSTTGSDSFLVRWDRYSPKLPVTTRFLPRRMTESGCG